MTGQTAYLFGYYASTPTPYSFYGQNGFWSVPAGHYWYSVTDKDGQQWVSPNPITRNADGSFYGSPIYAADLNIDGTLVFMDALANRQLEIDSPPRGTVSAGGMPVNSTQLRNFPIQATPTRIYSGSVNPNGNQLGNIGDQYNLVINGNFVEQFIKTSGMGTTQGWT